MRIMNRYRDLYKASLTDPAQFWAEAAREVTWTRPPQQILDDTRPPFYRWFPDAELNSCANALDRHVDAGRGGQAALIYDSPVTAIPAHHHLRRTTRRHFTFRQRAERTGGRQGDRVVIYMPMIPEAVIAMLACARIGAVHSVVFGGFAPHELATRIDDAHPAVIVSASCGVEPTRVVQYKPMLDAAIEASAHPPRHCVIVQRDRMRCNMVDGRDHDWEALIAAAQPTPAVPVAATDPLYILYTSGTTGKPKGIVRDNGGHAVALLWSMRHIYNIGPGDVFWAASDVGWVVGHSYIVYGPLLAGATTVLYEGKPVGTPNPGAFWRVVTAARRQRPLYRPDGRARNPQERPRRRMVGALRPSVSTIAVLRRGTTRPRHLSLGVAEVGYPRHRPLVADRDGLGDCRQSAWGRSSPDQTRVARGADAGLRHCHPAPRWQSLRTR